MTIPRGAIDVATECAAMSLNGTGTYNEAFPYPHLRKAIAIAFTSAGFNVQVPVINDTPSELVDLPDFPGMG